MYEFDKLVRVMSQVGERLEIGVVLPLPDGREAIVVLVDRENKTARSQVITKECRRWLRYGLLELLEKHKINYNGQLSI